jgi:hypothetical protein
VPVDAHLTLLCATTDGVGASRSAEQSGGFARYRPEVVTTLRDRLPELVRGLLPARGRPYDGEASHQRVVEHEQPAEPSRRISKIIISGCTPGAA